MNPRMSLISLCVAFFSLCLGCSPAAPGVSIEALKLRLCASPDANAAIREIQSMGGDAYSDADSGTLRAKIHLEDNGLVERVALVNARLSPDGRFLACDVREGLIGP